MNTREVWQYAQQHVCAQRFIAKDFLHLRRADFEVIQSHFTVEWNPWHREPSLRTRAWWWHVHAIDFGEIVILHCDIGNPVRSPILAIVHFFCDVVPYNFYCLTHRLNPFTVYRSR